MTSWSQCLAPAFSDVDRQLRGRAPGQRHAGRRAVGDRDRRADVHDDGRDERLRGRVVGDPVRRVQHRHQAVDARGARERHVEGEAARAAPGACRLHDGAELLGDDEVDRRRDDRRLRGRRGVGRGRGRRAGRRRGVPGAGEALGAGVGVASVPGFDPSTGASRTSGSQRTETSASTGSSLAAPCERRSTRRVFVSATGRPRKPGCANRTPVATRLGSAGGSTTGGTSGARRAVAHRAGADLGGREPAARDQRADVAAVGAIGVQVVGVARRPDARPGDRVGTVGGRGGGPDALDAAAPGEQGLHVVRGAQVRLGDDGPGARPQEARREVVDALDRVGLAALRQPRLAVAAGVAEVAQDDDRVRGQLDVIDKGLAEVLVGPVVAAGDRVEPEAVLGRRVERVAIPAGPAVAVAQVDHDGSAGQRVADRGPRGVRGVDRDDLRAGPAGGGRGLVREGAVLAGDRAGGTHDQGDARDRTGRRGGSGEARGGDESDEERDERRAKLAFQRSSLQPGQGETARGTVAYAS